MSDFTDSFWNIYIGLITLLSIIACGILLFINRKRKINADPSALHGHIWDEDLQEYDYPLPRWWMWLFYASLVMGLSYLALYPGLGSYQGILNWSSAREHDNEVKENQTRYAPLFEKYLRQDLPKVAADPQAHEIGERLFLNHCAQCHGSDARGSKGFPNLSDTDWLHGGAPAQIEASITEGHHGIMPAFGSVLGDTGIKDVANYVRSLSGLAADSIRVIHGKDLFAQNCVACHGMDAKGNTAIGAPNLTDSTWLYGSDENTLIDTLTRGRDNQMPAHKELLSEAKIHLLAAYVWSLSHPK